MRNYHRLGDLDASLPAASRDLETSDSGPYSGAEDIFIPKSRCPNLRPLAPRNPDTLPFAPNLLDEPAVGPNLGVVPANCKQYVAARLNPIETEITLRDRRNNQTHILARGLLGEQQGRS